jgi:hypothetical protein
MPHFEALASSHDGADESLLRGRRATQKAKGEKSRPNAKQARPWERAPAWCSQLVLVGKTTASHGRVAAKS